MKTTLISIILLTCLVAQSTAAEFEKDTFTSKGGKEFTITFIKHGTLMLNIGEYTIHIDPLTQYADYSTLPKADLILITHTHHDHFDKKALAATEKNETVIIGNEFAVKELGKGVALKNGLTHQLTDWLKVDAVPAYNNSPGKENYHPQGRDNGYVIDIDGTLVYIAGDTEDIPEMDHLKNVEIAIIPVNQPYTMSIEQAVRAARLIRPRILYPYHYGNSKVENIKEELKETSIEVRIRQMQ